MGRPRSRALSQRETEVLHLAMKGLTAKETAQVLGNKATTVREQRRTILRKLRARSLVHAAAIYLGYDPGPGA